LNRHHTLRDHLKRDTSREHASPVYERRSRVSTLAKISVASVLLYFAIAAVDWAEFGAVVKGVEPGFLVLVALVALVDRGWMAGKWYYLLRALSVPVKFAQVLWYYLVGGLVGMAVQWQLGGDIARVLGLGKRVGERQLVLASVIFEKVAGAAASGLLAAAAAVFLAFTVDLGDLRPLLPIALALFALTVVTPPMALSAPFRRTLRRLFKRLPDSLQVRFGAVTDAVLRVTHLGRPACVFFVLTLAEQIVPIINAFLLARAFQLDLGFLDVLRVMPIATFFSRLPISIESVGLREGLYVVLFSFFDVSPAGAFAMALAARVTDLLVVGLASLLGVFIQKKG
jgi:uncharacterized membrane protein YbhN (UPF0104 family)